MEMPFLNVNIIAPESGFVFPKKTTYCPHRLKERTVNVSFSGIFPFTMAPKNPDGKWTGIVMDLIGAAAEKIGFEMNIERAFVASKVLHCQRNITL